MPAYIISADNIAGERRNISYIRAIHLIILRLNSILVGSVGCKIKIPKLRSYFFLQPPTCECTRIPIAWFIIVGLRVPEDKVIQCLIKYVSAIVYFGF